MANLFVSPTGSDTTGNGSPTNPYQTIQKAASLAQPGDTVKIRAGIYRETVTPAQSGTQVNPIIYEAYPGESVTLSGADPLTNWESLGADLYRCTLPWPSLGVGNNQLFVAGQMLTESRYPFVANEPLQDRSTLLVATAGSGTQNGSQGNGSLRHPDLANYASGYWVGGRVNFNGNGEIFQTGAITQHTGDEIQFTFTWLDTAYNPAAGSLFFLWNKLPQLTSFQPREFYVEGNQVYVKLQPGATPTQIEAKQRWLAFNLTGKSWITIRGIKLFAAGIETGSVTQPTTTAGTGIVLDSLEVLYPHHQRSLTGNAYVDATLDTGICLRGTNSEIRNSRIQFSAGNGITLGGSNNKVQNCVVLDCDYLGADAAPIATERVFSANQGHIIIHNTVRGAGRSGIVHRKLKAGQIWYNDISQYGRLCADLGGTYCWGSDGEGTQIAYNRIDPPAADKYGVGLYLDNDSPNHVVYRNLILGSVQVNGPSVGVQFFNNTVERAMQFGASPTGPAVVRNNILLGGLSGAPTGATISHNCLRFDEPGLINREAQDYRLKLGSPSIDAGIAVPPYTDGFLGNAPDLGCFESGAPSWIPGAVVRDSEKAGLQGTVKRLTTGIALSISLPEGRKLPEGSQVKIGLGGTPSTEFSHSGNTAVFSQVASSSTAIESVYLRVGSGDAWQEIATVDLRPLAISAVTPTQAQPGTEITATGTQFPQTPLYQRVVSLTGVASPVASIVFDAASAIASGKMQPDGRDLRVLSQSGTLLPFWLDGAPGARTLLFVRFPAAPQGGMTQVSIRYGGGSEALALSSLEAVFPTLTSFNNKLWLAANDGVELFPSSQVVKKVRDRSGNGAGPTEVHTEYKQVVANIPNPNLGADAQGIPAFVFTGTQGLDIGNNFAIAQNQTRTFFLVQRYFQENWDSCVYGIGYSGNIDLGEYVGGAVEARLKISAWTGNQLSTVNTPNGSVPINRTNLIAITSQATTTEVRVQGTSVLSGAPAYHHYAIDGEFYLGRKRKDEAKRWYKGLIYEFIAFNTALSPTQIAAVEEYLTLKYLSPTSASIGAEQ
ncbi:MAG: LamG-like jellyroll fold domain-containing protein [Actinomycetota bacterium]